jgi:hypothetical protein
MKGGSDEARRLLRLLRLRHRLLLSGTVPAGRTTRRRLMRSRTVRLPMDEITLITIAVVVVGLALTWLVGFFSPRRGVELNMVVRLALGLLLAGTFIRAAERAARHGGWFIVPAVLLALVAVMGLALSAIPAGVLWLSLTGRIPDEEED